MTMQDIADLAASLKRERDELYLQLHLFRAETRDQWAELEKQWTQLRRKSVAASAAAGEAAGEISAAARLVGEEVRAGYRKIRDSLRAT